MFKVNNKETRIYFTTFSSIFIVDFEQVNVSWVPSLKGNVMIKKKIFEHFTQCLTPF